MQALFLLLFAPFLILNFFGGVVGGIWLAVLGEWRLLGIGIAYMICGAFLAGILMLPGMIFAGPAALAAQRQKFFLTAILGVPAIAWTFAVMTGTCALIFGTLVSHVEGTPIPYILWAYAVALAPWSYMASVETRSGNDAANVLLFFCQLGTISMMVAIYVDQYEPDFWRLVWWFVPFSILGLTVQLLIAVVEGRAAKRLYR
jgi:hypothetical protein